MTAIVKLGSAQYRPTKYSTFDSYFLNQFSLSYTLQAVINRVGFRRLHQIPVLKTTIDFTGSEPMTNRTIDVNPIAGALGAEISSVDLAGPIADNTLAEIKEAFSEHLVLFFRDQELSPQQHADFAGLFADLVPHPFVESIEGIPGIIEIVKEHDEKTNWGGTLLHSDLTFFEEPPMGAALYAREVPPHGGDTLWVNMYLAYEALSEGMKDLLGGLNAVHTSDSPASYSENYKGMHAKHNEASSTVHPAVITHPQTGRKALYTNSGYTKHFENMGVEESRPILDYLAEHAARPEFSCRFHWTPGAMAVWDNRVTMHYAIEDDFSADTGNGYRRVLHRATFAGVRPGL